MNPCCACYYRQKETSPSSSHLSAPANDGVDKVRSWHDKNSADLSVEGLKVLLVG